MFFNESVFLKQKYKAENIMLLNSNTRLMAVIEQKDGQLADKDKIITINAQEKEIGTQELNILKSQLKVVKRQNTKLTIGGSVVISGLLFLCGYSLMH